VAEEIGGQVDDVRPALVINDGHGVRHIFTARLVSIAPDTHTGANSHSPHTAATT
jgi:hypothetical protein